MSYSFRRLSAWLNRIVSKTASRTLNRPRSNKRFPSASEIDKASASSPMSTVSPFKSFRASIAFSTLSIKTETYCYRLSLISLADRIRSPPLSSIKGYGPVSRQSCRRAFSSSNFSRENSSSSLKSLNQSGSRKERMDYRIFQRTSSLTVASDSGCLMAAKGGSFPRPIFLKSSIMTRLPSWLTMLIISSTSSRECGWSMHFRKKESSSAVSTPLLFMSITLKAYRMSSSENSSRLMSQPVESQLQAFLVEILRRSPSCSFSVSGEGPLSWP